METEPTTSAALPCIQRHPSARTIKLGNVYVNQIALARAQNIDQGYMSRILNGVRDPGCMSINQAMKMASALGMGIDELLDGIYTRMELLANKRAQIQVWHDYRKQREAKEDAARAKKGLPAKPRIF